MEGLTMGVPWTRCVACRGRMRQGDYGAHSGRCWHCWREANKTVERVSRERAHCGGICVEDCTLVPATWGGRDCLSREMVSPCDCYTLTRLRAPRKRLARIARWLWLAY